MLAGGDASTGSTKAHLLSTQVVREVRTQFRKPWRDLLDRDVETERGEETLKPTSVAHERLTLNANVPHYHAG